MNKFYIVQGLGESTGCRLLTKILIDWGCYGKSGHNQDFDSFILNDKRLKDYFTNLSNLKLNPVIRFSYPHGNKIINLERIYKIIKDARYNNIYVLFTTRSFPATIISTKINHCVNNLMTEVNHKNPKLRAKLAHMKCFTWINNIYEKIDKRILDRFVIINLNDLSQYPDIHLRYISNELEIDIPKNYDYSFIKKDVNSERLKQYEDEYL